VAKDKKRKAQAAAPVTPAARPAPDVVPGPPAVEPPVVTPVAPGPPDMGRFAFGLSRVATALGGASLCYGEPVQAGERIVIPVARVRGAGGMGFGRQTTPEGEAEGDGGGGGGAVEASPAGFLDITPDGVRYEAIPDPVNTARALSTGASALTLLVGAVLGLRRRRRAAAGLLPKG
jgi:uncharacterized spore protein YtfJ